MSDYRPPFEITNEMLSYVASISEKIGRITATANLESKPHLRKNNRIKSIHSSLKIEANSLTLGQVRDVINGKQVLGEQKEIQEVKNAYAAYEKLSEIDPYSITDLKTFHGIMTRYVVDESGAFRCGEDGIFKCPNEFAFEDKGNEISDYLTKLYFFDENEQNARSFATTSILKLMEYSENKEFDKLDSDSLQAFRIAHFNFHLVNKSNMLNIKHFELRDVTKMELNEYTKKLHSDLKEYIPLRREIENATTIDEKERKFSLVKINQLISNAEMNIVGMLGVNYDETLANDFAETILSINEEFSETSPIAFTKLIETTKFSPTKEQFIRGAKVFRTNFNDNSDLNNICEFSTLILICIFEIT